MELILPQLPPAVINLIEKPTNSPRAAGHGQPIDEGYRNDTLFRYACALRGRGHDGAAIAAAVSAKNMADCRDPVDEDEVRLIASSATRYPVNFERSDMGNAKRLVARHGSNLRYCFDWNKWLVWAGTHWSVDKTAEVVRLAKEAVESILAESGACKDANIKEELFKWACRSQSRNCIESLIELAKSEPGIPVQPEELDTDTFLFNIQNGTADIRTGELRKHRREDLITRLAPTEFDPDARCPQLLQFLDRIMESDQERIGFVQRALGYSLTADTSEQCLFLFYGSGANGKSTLLNVHRAVCGPYAMQTPSETLLLKPHGGGIPNDIARLRGARFVTASEVDDGRKLAEALVKQLTGEDPVSARFMRGEFFDFMPQFKIFLATNRGPNLDGGDPAIWRRIHQIPFQVTIPEPERDRQLKDKLLEERSGILAWLVRGAVEWHRNGLQVPEVVRLATEDYRREMDLIGAFLEECCELNDRFETRATDLYSAYRSWSIGTGETPENQHRFGRDLSRRGYAAAKGGIKIRRGLRLKPPHA